MRAKRVILFFTIIVLACEAFPIVVRAGTTLVIPDAGFGTLPKIPSLTNTYQSAFRAGDKDTYHVSIQSPFGEPTFTVDLSEIGGPSSTTTSEYWAGRVYTIVYNGISYYPVYYFTFGPFTVGADISDGLKTIYTTATDPSGNTATTTSQIVVDNALPIFTISDIAFSTVPPKGGDLVYLSGIGDGTGTAFTVHSMNMALLDASGHQVGYTIPYENNNVRRAYKNRITAAIASSTDNTFNNVPIPLTDGAIKIADAASLKVMLVGYDGGGHVVNAELTVPIPQPPPPDPCIAAGTCVSNVLFLPGLREVGCMKGWDVARVRKKNFGSRMNRGGRRYAAWAIKKYKIYF